MVTFSKESRQTKRAKQRAEDKAEKKEKKRFNEVNQLLLQAFTKEEIKEIAYNTGIISRERELTALAFAGILLMGCVSDTSDKGIKTLTTMSSSLRKYFDINISSQAIYNKLNNKQAVLFVKEIVKGIIAYKFNKIFKKYTKRVLGPFSRILLQDSTVISLPDSMKGIFRGCGGAASQAAIKCDFIIDQINSDIVRVKLTDGKIPDISMSEDIIKYLRKGDLVVRDLGYFKLPEFLLMIEKEISFLSRLHISTNVYLNADDKEPVDLIEHLNKLDKKGKKEVDITVYLGKDLKVPVRLLAIKVPPEVIETRRQRYKENRKKEPSEEIQKWNGYTLMITNIIREELSLKTIMKFYKIRWQIELFFKNIKSNLCIDNITGTNKFRILCIIYIKIAISFMVVQIYSIAQGLIGSGKELSLDQFTKWLKEEGRLKLIFVVGSLSGIIKELKRDFDLLCKQKRNRQSTWDAIEETCKKEEKKASRIRSKTCKKEEKKATKTQPKGFEIIENVS